MNQAVRASRNRMQIGWNSRLRDKGWSGGRVANDRDWVSRARGSVKTFDRKARVSRNSGEISRIVTGDPWRGMEITTGSKLATRGNEGTTAWKRGKVGISLGRASMKLTNTNWNDGEGTKGWKGKKEERKPRGKNGRVEGGFEESPRNLE